MHRIRHQAAFLLWLWGTAGTGAHAADRPSFDGAKVRGGSIEALVCADPGLVQLDQRLAATYAQAARLARRQHPNLLPAEQRGWIKGRNDCWQDSDRRACVAQADQRRTAELQARDRLVQGSAPVTFICDGNAANVVLVTYFPTEPSTLVAEHGDQVSLMFQQPMASGTSDLGRNERFSEHQGVVIITWGVDARPMRCVRAG